MRRRIAAFTLVEAIVAMAIAAPLTYVAWSALFGSRVSEERAVAQGAALRGAIILQEYLYRDLASIDNKAGASACTIKDINGECAELTLKIARPSDDLASIREEVQYKLRPYGSDKSIEAFTVSRNGWKMGGVILSKFLPTVEIGASFNKDIEGDSFRRWLMIELRTLDPGLGRAKDQTLYDYETTVLSPMPWTPSSVSFTDYTTAVADASPVHGWVERLAADHLFLGGWNPDNPGTLPSFVVSIDDKVYPLQYAKTPNGGNVEQNGSAEYVKLLFNFYQPFRILLGQGYRKRKVKLSLGVVDPESKENKFFYRQNEFIPYPFTDLADKETRITHCAYQHHDKYAGLALYFTSSKPGRCCYRLVYPGKKGTYQATAWTLGDGLFFAYLAGFPENGDMTAIKVAKSWED